ncbi:hypothetical protein MNBD_NITROSPINAE02-729 [hydrothermal vent metagenome]|uniref:Deoxyhypusine synthase n=1 Tax=hydrothermal vent metagenome TaxID=652676 RepID=A0A3B1C139_9ZZZZ
MTKPEPPFEPADFSKIRTYSIRQRKSLVTIDMFASINDYKKSGKLGDLFPDILKAKDLRAVVTAIRRARSEGKPVIVGMGAHVIKVGLAPIIIDMMTRGFIDVIAMNGAGGVHDMEIAFHGATSEDVSAEIQEGRFGMVEETAAHFNGAIKKYNEPGRGLGERLGRYIVENKMPGANVSILAMAYELGKVVTIHSAIGTDIVHMHPGMDGGLTGEATLNDFKLFTGAVSRLTGGGVYMNIGSAVLLPEVFIKALSAARNLGSDVSGFTTVNMDMIQGYRPTVNVVNRPIKGEGEGISLTGSHEIMIPLLYHLLLNEGEDTA